MMTKIDAVNQMLDAIGETPVSSLSSGLPDAEKAERILDRVTDRVLEKGWHVNTDYEYTMARDENNRIRVPDNVLRIDTDGKDQHRDVVVRKYEGARYLYDRDEKSFTFTKNLSCTVVWSLDFESLTPQLQNYIASEAARIFQSSEMSSVQLDQFALREEGQDWAALQDAEAESEDTNALLDSPHTYWITRRHSRSFAR